MTKKTPSINYKLPSYHHVVKRDTVKGVKNVVKRDTVKGVKNVVKRDTAKGD